MVDLLVVDRPLAYNAIVERPTSNGPESSPFQREWRVSGYLILSGKSVITSNHHF